MFRLEATERKRMSFWESLLDRLREFGETVIEWAILLGIALVVLVIGRWVIQLIRKATEKVLGAKALDGVWERSGVAKALEEGDQTPASISATIVYAYLMVGLFVIVARILELGTIEGLLTRLLAWIPLLLIAAAIVLIAAAAGSWAAGLVKPFADEQNVPWLTYVVHIGVILFGLLFAMDIMQVVFAEDIVKIVIAAGAIALAIAFGVGGIDTAKKWWAKYASPSGSSSDRDSANF
jgi:Mechanosensitive ion channel, conserved TM helix